MIKRLFTTTSSQTPLVTDFFGRPQNISMAYPKGFMSLPDVNDELIVADPYNNGLETVGIGIVEPFDYGLEPGDRLIITPNAFILLKSDGLINIKSTGGTINIDTVTNGTINIGGTNQNVNLIGNVKVNGSPI